MDSDKNSSIPGRRIASRLSSETSDNQTTPNFNGKKRDEIFRACETRDIHALASLCLSEGGLLQDDLRQAACKISFPIHFFPSMIIQSLYLFRNSHHYDLGPILLGYDPNSNHLTGSEWTKMPVHDDEEQVKLDVDRSFVHYPNCMDHCISQNLNLSEK